MKFFKLGDFFHSVAQPVAKTIDAVAGTDIKNCSGCAARRAMLNDLSDKVFDIFWSSDSVKTTSTMQYIVSKQIAVEANSPEEAVANAATKGNMISLNVTARPQQQPIPQHPGTPASAASAAALKAQFPPK